MVSLLTSETGVHSVTGRLRVCFIGIGFNYVTGSLRLCVIVTDGMRSEVSADHTYGFVCSRHLHGGTLRPEPHLSTPLRFWVLD